MKYKTANIFANYPNIKHAFFSKTGGYSSGSYESLNCSLSVGDCDQIVIKNLELIKSNFGAEEIISLKQVHGNSVVVVKENFDFSLCNQQIEADAIVTKIKKICISVLTADCAPVLIFDLNNEIVGAIHCGWKSARYGAIENTIYEIRKLACKETKLVAAIGPCIHKENYIVDQDFVSNFSNEDSVFFEEESEKFKFDLPAYVKNKLTDLGVLSTEIIDINTYTNHNFFSFRRARTKTNGMCGRQLSCIMLSS